MTMLIVAVCAAFPLIVGVVPMSPHCSSESDGVDKWRCADVPLKSAWSKEVSVERPHPEYPRPQMVRDAWQSLNGLWDYAIVQGEANRPTEFDGRILVPFPIESALSGVKRALRPSERLWYRRAFRVPSEWDGGRILLHFGAVDWEAAVFVNGTRMGTHRGGYDPFMFDITEALRRGEDNELVVAVRDPTDSGTQPRGKQVLDPKGIWYTSTSGIWQTVWIEHVPQTYIRDLEVVPDFDAGAVSVSADIEGVKAGARVRVRVLTDGKPVADAEGAADSPVRLKLTDARAWSPEDPHLYDLEVSVVDGDDVVDRVESYFGLRKIAVVADKSGKPRLFLNNEPLFQYGLLDQGFWPAGLYTAPTDEALRYDIEVAKKLGFNMLRKHVKVEPARWYMWCDRLGMLVWQDMPSGDRHIRDGADDLDRTPESAAQFRTELRAMVDALRHHPSIVMWVPFNEGWGQFDTAKVARWLREYDSTRLVNSASGWVDRDVGDVIDIHAYPGPGMAPVEKRRASVLGEFGGLGWPVSGHLWWDRRNWGYRTYTSRQDLQQNYAAVVGQLVPLIGQGLAAAVYTQLTDVEGEVNGLLTYDRAVLKLDESTLRRLHRPLYGAPLDVRDLVPNSAEQPQSWRFTTKKPSGKWADPGYDDSTWEIGEGMFGQRDTPGVRLGTSWTTSDIWLRRTFDLDGIPSGELYLTVFHDEDARVYINGVLAGAFDGYVTSHRFYRIEPAARRALKAGSNTLAVHCHQSGGGQGIDVGLVIAQPAQK